MENDHDNRGDNGRKKNRIKVVWRRRLAMSTCRDGRLPLYASSKKKFTPCPPSHEVFKYLVPLLAALVAMRYQAKGKDPFEACPINMWCFCISTFIYCLAMGIQNQTKTRDIQVLAHVILVSGALSSISLGSVILPHFLGQLIFAVLAFLLIILARNKLKHAYYWLYNRVTNVVALLFPNVQNYSDRHNQPYPSPPV
ncbi:unnamed protein product [Ilex paraguariensis]|uniref:Uncharacterized protein n=1 Tax=Ilex paraguariensis TaxID=185542 RepID=A0ABC8SQF6_9AQUA